MVAIDKDKENDSDHCNSFEELLNSSSSDEEDIDDIVEGLIRSFEYLSSRNYSYPDNRDLPQPCDMTIGPKKKNAAKERHERHDRQHLHDCSQSVDTESSSTLNRGNNFPYFQHETGQINLPHTHSALPSHTSPINNSGSNNSSLWNSTFLSHSAASNVKSSQRSSLAGLGNSSSSTLTSSSLTDNRADYNSKKRRYQSNNNLNSHISNTERSETFNFIKSHSSKLHCDLQAQEKYIEDGTKSSDENNSEDEYYGGIHGRRPQRTDAEEALFGTLLKEKKQWEIREMVTDGACLFRSVSDQLYGDQEFHDEVRRRVMDYIHSNPDHFAPYITEDFSRYVQRKRNPHCHGNHVEIQAISEIYNRPVEIYHYEIDPCNVFHGEYKTDSPALRLSYHGGNHYNSIRDPYAPTVGVGLGLPELSPGQHPDTRQLQQASIESETYHIEEAMLKDKLLESDWQLTEAEIEQKVLNESLKEWMSAKRYKGKCSERSAAAGKAPGSPLAGQAIDASVVPELLDTVASEKCVSVKKAKKKSSSGSKPNSPLALSASAMPVLSNNGACGGATSPCYLPVEFNECASSVMNDCLPIEMHNWSEDEIMAQAIAASQEEYLRSLKRRKAAGGGGRPGCSKDSN